MAGVKASERLRRQWREAAARHRLKRIKAGLCLYPGCHKKARASRRYCEQHKGKGGIR